ncbi:hypothetical protein C0Z01_08940 [Photobacterium kishitanii]|uniref:Uncharacterized protein n=1 Tax=Photobacterium kishitanii TaxID=318456 RepID=A0A2T3KBA5_9GAMM|nr:hypothetical protein [Photobacterium kishitanii]KJG06864.1 hypothetical protein UB40_19590 [Photobacterium kishitanii]KJG55221.1 hypothetical protein UA38_20875 [Photobacterium kishitanii]KJG58396.1 hypothetical protein UA42_19715 [Photobacterium kishitanii]KJG63839.1 hypothetical protein UA40_19725 [Photobacterium kishitanii]KJG67327.1 hypothetical protein UA41_19300 [Photobacterium kishitanii]
MQPKIYIKLEDTIWKVTVNGQWLAMSPSEVIDIKIPFITEHQHFNDVINIHFNEKEVLTDLG